MRSMRGFQPTHTRLCAMAHRFCPELRVVLAACALAGLAACRTAPDAADAPVRARKVQTLRGLGFPESVRYDPDQDG